MHRKIRKPLGDIPVVILCGGQGTRIRENALTKKELVKVGDNPIIWHIMRYFSHYGYGDFVLTLGYLADHMKRYFLEYEPMSRDITLRLGTSSGHPEIKYADNRAHPEWTVSLVDTGLRTEKATRIHKVNEYLDKDRFFVTYGDDLCDVDLEKLVRFHRRHKKLATITSVQVKLDYGVAEADSSGLVSKLVEKPPLDYWINGGFMLFEREVLDNMSGDNVSLEREVLPLLARKNELMIYRHEGFWQSMNTMKENIVLEDMWQKGEAPWKVWED